MTFFLTQDSEAKFINQLRSNLPTDYFLSLCRQRIFDSIRITVLKFWPLGEEKEKEFKRLDL